MQLTQDLIQIIKDNNPIKEVMADYGIVFNSSNKCCCPFHDEQTPSFHFHPETSSYYCYGCGAGSKGKELKLKNGTCITDAGSDVIGFISNIEQVTFQEACKVLMKRADIPIPTDKSNYHLEPIKDIVTNKNRLYYLNLIKNEEALDYLSSRNITLDDIKKWRLGYTSPNDLSIKPHIRGRIAFGIQEDINPCFNPKTIAIAYRKIHEHQEGPKYINDPTSKIYNKSQVLYGLNYATQAIKRKKYAIVMEGYIDVIRAHAVGLDNSVAICGTAITQDQIKKLKKLTDQVFLWLDGDEAGISSAIKNLPHFLAEGFSVMIITSNGQDPAEVFDKLNSNTNDIINYISLYSKPAVQYIIETSISNYESILYKEKIKVLNQVMPIINSIQKENDRLIFTSDIYKKLGINT